VVTFVSNAFHLLLLSTQKIKVNWRASNASMRKDLTGELLVILRSFQVCGCGFFHALSLSFSFVFQYLSIMSEATCNSPDVNCTEVSELAERIEMSLSVSQASQKEVHETEKKDSTTSPSETCTTANSTGGEREPSVEYTSDRKRFSKEGHSRCMPGYDALRILYKYSSWFE
jgi:hypothetical protein